MKVFLALVFALILPMAALAADADQKAEGQATDSARAWLALVDAGKYADAWTAAGADLRSGQTADKWTASIKPMREPLGAATFRHPAGVVMQTSASGTHDSALVFFTTTFAQKAEASEKLTMKMVGGDWKVTSYTVK
jgi:hypothetical protein